METTQVELRAPVDPQQAKVLSPEALAFVGNLTRRFRRRIDELLERRRTRQRRFDAGERPGFLAETARVRSAEWTVAPLPADLLDRRVEITGPVDRKMIINALNSGASVFMADFEDSTSPTWHNIAQGQANLCDAVRRTIEYTAPETQKRYRLGERTAVLMVRPRGWHLLEKHARVDGLPTPAALWDFGIFFFNNAKELIARGSGPYFYLPKLESHLEARLWNEVFLYAQSELGIRRGTVKATVLLETLPAAFEMDEILWELREHSAGLNCGRWDYIFSFIKRFRMDPAFVLPDRGQLTMDKAFLNAYVQLLIQTCHRREVHAMGGMAAQIPIKEDPAANEAALAKVRADKLREVKAGHDGTWVAHPALVPIAKAVFDQHMKSANQLHVKREDVRVGQRQLLEVPVGARTEAGLRHSVRVSIQYLEAWLGGSGCVPLYDLMEDAATAEISRAQVWQWIHHGASLDNGQRVTSELFRSIVAEEMERIHREVGDGRFQEGRFYPARQLFEELSTSGFFEEFLTLPAYELLIRDERFEVAPAAPRASGPSSGAAPEDPDPKRWEGITRPYGKAEVEKLRGSLAIEHTLARLGARRFWELLHQRPFLPALGALTGNQAVQMVKAGLEAIYCSGWQIAADANTAAQTYPDQSLYPADSVPAAVRRINRALQRADQIAHAEGKTAHFYAPIVADAEAGFGGPLNAFELMKAMVEAGAAAVHFEDQLSSEKKCGHLGGKVLVPMSQFVRTLIAARLAADVMGVSTVLIARTDAHSAKLLTSDVDPRDHQFIEKGERTPEGFFRLRGGIECAIARALAYAPYADLLWCETSTPDLQDARRFAEGVHASFPGKMLAYNCSPSFNWKKNLDDPTIARFQRELGAMGYKFQFVTLAGFHALNYAMFELASGYRELGMSAYSELQQAEFEAEKRGYTATRHQAEVGTGYFDSVAEVISGGTSSTLALAGSTEAAQFREIELAKLKEEHARVEQMTTALRKARSLGELAGASDELRETLRAHFQYEEASGGFYALLRAHAPQFQAQISRMLEEHQLFLAEVARFAQRVRSAPDPGPLIEEAARLTARLHEHEQREHAIASTVWG